MTRNGSTPETIKASMELGYHGLHLRSTRSLSNPDSPLPAPGNERFAHAIHPGVESLCGGTDKEEHYVEGREMQRRWCGL